MICQELFFEVLSASKVVPMMVQAMAKREAQVMTFNKLSESRFGP
jgi:hypothetical protein